MNDLHEDVQIIIGLVEPITFETENGPKTYLSRIDTGAARSSIDTSLSKELKLGPVVGESKIRSAQGRQTRPVVEVDVYLANKAVKGEFTIADRCHMQFSILIGRDILEQGFLIDPSKNKVQIKEDEL